MAKFKKNPFNVEPLIESFLIVKLNKWLTSFNNANQFIMINILRYRFFKIVFKHFCVIFVVFAIPL